jgi:hypothetical protein
MFQLAPEESGALRSQIGALKTGRGKHRKYAPYVFTEQGVANAEKPEPKRRGIGFTAKIDD